MTQTHIDTILARRGLRDNTLGPTGKAVFCDRLENAIGMRGTFWYLHSRDDGLPINDPIVLTITVNGVPISTKRAAVYWHPSHLYRRTTEHSLCIQENKFITHDDVLIDQLELTNEGDVMVRVVVETSSGALSGSARVGKDGIAGGWRTYGQSLRMILAAPARPDSNARVLRTELLLRPGESAEMFAAVAVAGTQQVAQEALRKWADSENPLGMHEKQYQGWFDRNCPKFECSDPYVNVMWWYRWFVARHNYAEPGVGKLRHPVFYEGKHGGYSRAVTASAPLILNEVRWLRDARYAHGEIQNFVKNQPKHGIYRDLWVDAVRGLDPGREGNPDPGYEEFLPAAFWGALLVHPSISLLEDVAVSITNNLEGLRKLRDQNDNLLLNPGGHHMTQEHAPSFAHFHDYADWYDYTELERPDYSAFFYGSLCAAAAAHRHLAHSKLAEWFDNMAARCADAICEHLWDDEDGFFYPIREADGEFARCVEANGMFPFAWNAVPNEAKYHRAVDHLLDDRELFTQWPFATASRRCPAFSAHPGYWGTERKSSIAMWNGPTWPYTNSILAEAMANLIRHHTQDTVTEQILCAFIGRFARMMFEEEDAGSPLVREVYDSETGEGYGCPDYFHSSFNDLIVRFMCGIVPLDDDELIVDPLCVGWTHFRLENVRYRGHDVSIIWEGRARKQAYDDVEPGLTVIVDGEVAAHQLELGLVSVSLGPGDEDAEEPPAEVTETAAEDE